MLSTVYSLYNSVKLDFFTFFSDQFCKMIEETKQIMCYPSCTNHECLRFPYWNGTFLFWKSRSCSAFLFFFFFFLFFGFFRTFLFGERESSLPPNIKDEMRWAVPQMRDVFICSLSFCDYLRFHVLTHSFIYSFTHTQQLFPRRAFTCII